MSYHGHLSKMSEVEEIVKFLRSVTVGIRCSQLNMWAHMIQMKPHMMKPLISHFSTILSVRKARAAPPAGSDGMSLA